MAHCIRVQSLLLARLLDNKRLYTNSHSARARFANASAELWVARKMQGGAGLADLL